MVWWGESFGMDSRLGVSATGSGAGMTEVWEAVMGRGSGWVVGWCFRDSSRRLGVTQLLGIGMTEGMWGKGLGGARRDCAARSALEGPFDGAQGERNSPPPFCSRG